MSNSSLVCYTKISPNKTSPRNHEIDTITIHHMAGNLSVETCGNLFAQSSQQASSNYGIGSDGRIGMYVEEKDRSWCSSSASNDHRAITIEVANDGGNPDWHVSDAALESLIKLCADICKRNNIKEMLWKGDKSLIGQVDKQNVTIHKWFMATACPGPYLESMIPYVTQEVNKMLAENVTLGTDLKDLSEEDVIKKVGPSFTEDERKSGILACVSLAQFILESGYGHSELATNANNFFGMKTSLSGNTWPNSSWDGTSKYTKETKEQLSTGEFVTITADFRSYPCLENSIADHSAYLLGAKNGNDYRYPNIAGMKDYREVAQLIKDGGYATSIDYVDKLCNIIEKWDLTQYNLECSNESEPECTLTFPECPFLVQVKVSDLCYRKEPSINSKALGVTGVGTFTIVEVSSGWGKLKSGAGWIWLGDYSCCTIKTSELQSSTTSTKPVKPSAPTTPATPAKKSVTEIAKEVISGKWGNGAARKSKLEAAGYSYSEVQAKVHELMGRKPSTSKTPAKKSVTELAKEVWAGKWGNGSERKRRLTQAGYDYAAVQAEVYRLYR